MIGRYALLAGRIRQDLAEIERVVDRIERAVQAGHRNSAEQDLFLDSAALNLHDFYTGLERICSADRQDVRNRQAVARGSFG